MGANRRSYGWIMAVYLLGIFIGAIDTGILTPARTVVQNSFGVGEKTGIWMITAFTLAYACAMPVLGKLADRMGRKRVYMVSIALFGTGSLICGLSNFTDSFSVLLIGRVIQAFGGGGIMPLATAEFGTSFPQEKRGMALGLVGGVYGVANIFGATLGSALLDLVGVANWHWLFFINVPICVLVVLTGIFVLPRGEKAPSRRIDLVGTLLLAVMVLSLLYSINNLNFFDFAHTITAANVYPFLIVFAVLLPVFLFVERKAADPIFNLSYFRNPNIALTFFVSTVVGICLMGMVFVPQFAENALKTPAGSGGYFVTILGLFAGIGAPLSGRLVDRFGPKKILMFGFAVSLGGALFLALVATVTVSVFNVILSLVLVGTGLGFVMGTPLNYMMLANTRREESNSAMSALSLMRSIGTTIGPVVMIGFLAQAGAGAQDDILNILPPTSSTQIQADAATNQAIRDDLIFVRDSLARMNAVKAGLAKDVDALEAANAELGKATAARKVSYEAVKNDPELAAGIEKLSFAEPETTEDFAQIRRMLDKGSDLTAADIDEKLKMLDFGNRSGMSFTTSQKGELPDDVLQRLQASDVRTIVEDVKYLSSRMFEMKTPPVIAKIQEGIGDGVAGLQSGVEGLTSAAGGIADGLKGLREGSDGMGQGIQGVDQGLEGMNQGLAGMDDAVKGIQSGIQGIRTGMANLQKGRDGISRGIAGMQQGLAQLDAQIITVSKQLADAQAAGQPPYITGPLAGQLEGLRAGRGDLQAKLDASVRSRAKMDAAIRSMKRKIASMQASVQKIDSAKPKLTALIAAVKTERADMAQLQSLMDGAAAKMASLNGMVQQDAQMMAGAKDKLAVLQQGIPGYFADARAAYLQEIDGRGAQIEASFQSAINEGFTGMYYCVAAFSAVAMAALAFYRQNTRKTLASPADKE